jgi:hypothetical protein
MLDVNPYESHSLYRCGLVPFYLHSCKFTSFLEVPTCLLTIITYFQLSSQFFFLFKPQFHCNMQIISTRVHVNNQSCLVSHFCFSSFHKSILTVSTILILSFKKANVSHESLSNKTTLTNFRKYVLNSHLLYFKPFYLHLSSLFYSQITSMN